MTHRILIDRSLCSGFGACAELAPRLVELGPGGTAATRVGMTDDPAALELPAVCPMSAISLAGEAEAA